VTSDTLATLKRSGREVWVAITRPPRVLPLAVTPPITRVARRDGRPALDGGFHDNAPVPRSGAAWEPMIVLPTRFYPRLPSIFRIGARVYVQPGARPRHQLGEYRARRRAWCICGGTCRCGS
jgi:hypothetical protein